MFLELNSKGLHQSSGKEKESCCLLFPSSTKREIRHFHVVVVQRRLRNAQKSVMYVHSCCFAYSMYCFFAVLVVRWRQRLWRWPRYPRKTQYLGFYTHNMVSGIALPVYYGRLDWTMDLRLCEYEFAKQGHVPQIVTAISPLHVLFFTSLSTRWIWETCLASKVILAFDFCILSQNGQKSSLTTWAQF